MKSKEQAQDWMRQLHKACTANGHLIRPESLYEYTRADHMKFAREIGYGLQDFDVPGQKEILSSSYSVIYVRACQLRSLLNAQEWVQGLKDGDKKRLNNK